MENVLAAALGLDVSEAEAANMIELLDEDGDAHINYQEWRRFVVLLPGGWRLLSRHKLAGKGQRKAALCREAL